MNFAFSRQGAPGAFNRDQGNRVQFGFAASPTLSDLDNTGKLDIIAGGLDRHLYVFQPDGTEKPGFPVLLQAPEYVSSVDPVTDRIHYNQSIPYGTKIVSSPIVADLFTPVPRFGLLAATGVFALLGGTISGWLSDRWDNRLLLCGY